MRISEAAGVGMRDATDYLVKELMQRHQISRKAAVRLLAETLVRNCVVDEILATSDALKA